MLTPILIRAAIGAVTGFTGGSISVALQLHRQRRRQCACSHPRRVHGLYGDAECAVCGCGRFTARRVPE